MTGERISVSKASCINAHTTYGNILLKERNQTIKNKVKLRILGVPVHKLGN